MIKVAKLVIVTLLVVFLISISAPVFAGVGGPIWSNEMYNTTMGLKGVASSALVAQRHPNDEYYVTSVNGYGGANHTKTGFGWQITDALDWPLNRFDCNLHVKWPSGGEDYYNYWVNMSQDQYHRLKIDLQSDGQTWYCYLDNNHVMTCVWPYYNSSETYVGTSLEVGEYDGTLYDNLSGHHYDVWKKSAGGSWSQQGGTSTSIQTFMTNDSRPNPFTKYNPSFTTRYLYIWQQNWDWEARKP